jgi:WD40 repeat protein
MRSSDPGSGDPTVTSLDAAPSLEAATRTAPPSSEPRTPPDVPSAAARRDPARYELLGEHGRGGRGRVSRAHDNELGRDVAIKELLSRSPLDEVRFLREALITARLEHPGIVPVHEAGRWPDGTPFYAMKLVSGRSLRELIAERKTVDERIALLHHVIAVADAIAYAHDRHIIHRDLKPANVVVGDFGETIVIDWGLAKDVSDVDELAGSTSQPTPGGELTEAGKVVGTPAYMSPEQARGEHVDQRADVYAIGLMLWELCAPGDIRPGDPRGREAVRRARIDDDLVAIIDKALDPDPQRRYRDAGALAADLKAFKAGARIAARRYSLYAMLAHWARRHRAAALAALAFLALLITSATALAVLYRASSQNAATARDRLIQSYEEQGRRLMLEDDYPRALPYLAAAYAEGDHSTAVRLLLARAARYAGAELAVHVSSRTARAAAFRSDATQVLSVSDDGAAAVWDASNGRVIASLPPREGGPYYGKVSRDGAFVAVARPEGVTLWDGAHARTLAVGQADWVAIDASGTRVAFAIGREVSAWSAATGERLWTASTDLATTYGKWAGDAVVAVDVELQAQIAEPGRSVKLAASGPILVVHTAPGGAIATLSGPVLELWEPTGARRLAITEHVGIANAALSPDGRRVALGRDDGIVRLYDTATGVSLGELVGHHSAVAGLAFSDDATRLATTGSDLTLRVWDLARGRQLTGLTLSRGTSFVYESLRFDATADRLVVLGFDGAAHVFATANPDAALTIDAGEPLDAGAFVDHDRRFATSSSRAVGLWATATGNNVGHLDVPAGSAARVSPDGTKLAIVLPGERDAEIRDMTTGALLGRFHGSQLRPVGFDHASQRAVGVLDTSIELWSVRGERLAALPDDKVIGAAVSFSPDDRRIASGGLDGARIWDISSGRMIGEVNGAAPVTSVEFDATGTRLLIGHQNGTAILLDATTLAPIRSYERASTLASARICAGGALIAAVSSDGLVSVWDTATSLLLAQFSHGAATGDLAVSRDGGRRLLTTGSDQRAVIWRLDLEDLPPAAVAAFARCHAPYRLVETRLEPATPVCD